MKAKFLKLIGWHQLVGGALGVIFFALLIVRGVDVPFIFPFGYFIIAPALFCLSAFAGALILRSHPLALTLSIVVQALQVVQIISRSFTYKFTAGINFIFFISSSHVRLSPGFHNDYWIGSSSFVELSGIAINFIAVGILIYLVRKKRELSRLCTKSQSSLTENEEMTNI